MAEGQEGDEQGVLATIDSLMGILRMGGGVFDVSYQKSSLE